MELLTKVSESTNRGAHLPATVTVSDRNKVLTTFKTDIKLAAMNARYPLNTVNNIHRFYMCAYMV